MKPIYLTIMLALAHSAFAQPAPTQALSNQGGVVNFQTTVEKAVRHNVFYATIFTQHQHKNLEQANENTNRILQATLHRLKAEKDVQVLDNQIMSRIHFNDKNQQDGWIVKGEIRLKSQDPLALSRALTHLKGTMAIRQLSSGISQEKLASLDKKMLEKALQKMQENAQFISQRLQAKDYKILSLTIQHPENEPPVYLNAVSYRSMPTPTPVFSEQSSQVKASVDAQIQLLK